MVNENFSQGYGCFISSGNFAVDSREVQKRKILARIGPSLYNFLDETVAFQIFSSNEEDFIKL